MKAFVSNNHGSVEVEITAIDRMTPKSAIAFRNVALGVGASATVSGGGKTYRVVGNSARKAKPRYD